MSSHVEAGPLSSLAKFQITKFQYLLATISAVAVLTLGLMSTLQSNTTTDKVQALSTIETPAESIISTQRETLVYATRLAQWSNGATTRRTVQIARSLLEQRLSVIDTSGKSMAERAPKAYRTALARADAIVADGPVGVLPNNLQSSVNAAISPAIDQIFTESRKFFVIYQKSIDQTLFDTNRKIADQDRLNSTLLYIFLIFGGFFLLFNIRSNVRNYRLSKITLAAEQIKSKEITLELEKAQLAVIELLDLDRAANTFISTINHELRTPLTSIIGYIDLIRREKLVEDDSEFCGYLEVLERNADILLDLVESILSINLMDFSRGALSEDRVHINKVVDNAIFIMKPEIERLQLKVHFSADGELFVQGNAGQISQVVINLLANAAKFSPPGGAIEISVDQIQKPTGKNFVRIQIEDHGIGIPTEDVDRLFTRFFRAKNAVSRQFPGTGLGLAIVHEMVTHHGGEVYVSSVLGEGTTFTLEIPTFLAADRSAIAAAIDSSTTETSQ